MNFFLVILIVRALRIGFCDMLEVHKHKVTFDCAAALCNDKSLLSINITSSIIQLIQNCTQNATERYWISQKENLYRFLYISDGNATIENTDARTEMEYFICQGNKFVAPDNVCEVITTIVGPNKSTGSTGLIVAMTVVALLLIYLCVGGIILFIFQARSRQNTTPKPKEITNIENLRRNNKETHQTMKRESDNTEPNRYFVLDKQESMIPKELFFKDETIFYNHSDLSGIKTENQADDLYIDTPEGAYDRLNNKRGKVQYGNGTFYGSLKMDDEYDVTYKRGNDINSVILTENMYSATDTSSSVLSRTFLPDLIDGNIYEITEISNNTDNPCDSIYQNCS